MAWLYFAVAFLVALKVSVTSGSAEMFALALVGLIGLGLIFLGVVKDLEEAPSHSSFL